MNHTLNRLCLVSFMVILSGCSMFSSKKSGDASEAAAKEAAANMIKFSDNPQMPAVSQRNYKRMTKQRLEEESEVQSSAGSLWVMEGQGAYLFSQNKVRKEGDSVTLRLEGAAQKQIEQKVAVIRNLLKEIAAEEAKKKAASEASTKEASAEKSGDGKNIPIANTEKAKTPNADLDKEDPLDLTSVAAKVIEKSSENNYRVKGQMPFMLGKNEYKVIVAGTLRAEDFNDEGISSNKLLDGQYDVVSIRKRTE